MNCVRCSRPLGDYLMALGLRLCAVCGGKR